MAWEVIIKGSITKTIRIDDNEADSEDDAVELAHQQFTVAPEEGAGEKYEEETINVTEVE